MPSGSGLSARSHSSVHAVRSMRAGLPVNDRDRTVSDELAARNLSLTTGSVSASSVVSHTEPHHTPFGAQRQRGGDLAAPGDATRGQHRHRGHRVDDLGNQHHRRNLAGVTTGFGALGDDQVDAGLRRAAARARSFRPATATNTSLS